MQSSTIKNIKLYDDQKEMIENIRKKLDGVEFVSMKLATPSKRNG